MAGQELAVEMYEFYAESTQARSPSTIRAQAEAILDRAVDEAVFAPGEPGGQRFLPFDSLRAKGAYKKVPDALKPAELKQVLTGFLVARGVVTRERFWMALKKGGYVGFMLLMEKGKKGSAQWALANAMSKLIKHGKKSNLLDFLEKSGCVVKQEMRMFCFAKGYTLANDPEDAKDWKLSLEAIIQAMADSRGRAPRTLRIEAPAFIDENR